MIRKSIETKDMNAVTKSRPKTRSREFSRYYKIRYFIEVTFKFSFSKGGS